jgi:hypothetical protein
MDVDRVDGETATLPHRANLALLTLQLRDAEREAADAELAEAGWDLDTAIAELRSRMAPVIAERRRTLDDELALERLKAAEEIAAARREAADIIEDARATNAAAAAAFADVATRVDDDAELVAWEEHEPAPETSPAPTQAWPPVVPDLGVAFGATVVDASPAPIAEAVAIDAESVEIQESSDLAEAVEVDAQDAEIAEASAAGAHGTTTLREGQTITLVLDTESFAKAFAAAFTAAFGDRSPYPAVPPPPHYFQLPTAPPEQRSFWANTWHADVLLSLIALVIVLAILAAWAA